MSDVQGEAVPTILTVVAYTVVVAFRFTTSGAPPAVVKVVGDQEVMIFVQLESEYTLIAVGAKKSVVVPIRPNIFVIAEYDGLVGVTDRSCGRPGMSAS
jgi:hypothetical protein